MARMKKMTLRNIPDGLHTVIADIAKANHRTINATILIALEGFAWSAKPTKNKPTRKGRK